MEDNKEFIINQNHNPLILNQGFKENDLLHLLQSDNVWHRIDALNKIKCDPNFCGFDEMCYPCIVSVPEAILPSIKIEGENVTFDENMFIVNKMSRMISMIEPASYVQFARHLFKSYRDKVIWKDY